MSKRGPVFLWINLCVALVFTPPQGVDGAEPSAPRKIRAGYTSISGNMTPLWAAKEGGYLKKHGLDAELISMPSGNEGMNALIAGELQFLAIAGSTTATAAVGGAEVVALATTIDRLGTSLIVGPAGQKPEGL